ncbi:MAG: DUF3343 domain-containing protein [Clostridia bacterium]|nr:DUF3343 domain-containing protein [Clostridia bacterium]MBQ8368557.1 DUF3343 domain-containing protein [Clostridia bacterium]MBQ8512965.1 DUF3343 domain-containing protein [Clostridia bacterium]
MADCIIAMKSQTTAEKARRIAASEKIRAQIVSVDPSLTRHGCSLGLMLDCADAVKLTETLERRNIAHGDIIGRVSG